MKAEKDAMPEIETLPDGYRLTELGPLPEEWQVVRLGEVFSIVPKKQRELRIQDEVKYRLLTVRLYSKGIVLRSEQTGSQIGTKVLYSTETGDFIFSKIDARNGAWGFINKDLSGGLVSGDFPILKIDRRNANEDFVSLLLSRPVFWEKLRNFAVGTTNRRRIQPSHILSLPIPLPPLAEQRAIAHVLRVVQRAKEASERVIAALRELKKSLMRHLFTYGPVPVSVGAQRAVPLQDTELGPLPAHWQVVRLGEVGEVRGGSAFPYRFQGKRQGEYPFYKVSDMNSYENRIWMTKAQHYVDEMDFTHLRAKLFPRGTIIFPKIGGAIFTNKKRLLSADALIDNNVMGITVREDSCHHLFLFYYLQSIDLRDFARIGPLPSITSQRVKDEIIPLPPLSEQHEIARILQTVDRRIEAEEAYARAAQELFRSLLNELMSGRRRLPAEFVARFQQEEQP